MLPAKAGLARDTDMQKPQLQPEKPMRRPVGSSFTRTCHAEANLNQHGILSTAPIQKQPIIVMGLLLSALPTYLIRSSQLLLVGGSIEP